MADAKAFISMSLRDEASKQLKSFGENFRRTVGAIEGEDAGAGAGVAQLAADVTSLDGALTMLGLSAPQVAVAMGALRAAATAVEWGRQAAEVQAVETSFTRLAASVGSSGAAMMFALNEVAQGTIADKDLMLAANSAMALGVADTADEMGALLQVAIAKGAEFGRTPTQAFGELINGLGRMSPEILNNIGVLIDADAAYAAYAASIGKTVDQLSEQEKMQALVNSVLAANPGAAEQAAALADSASGAFARWDVATTEFSEAFGTVFLPVITTGLNIVTGFVNAIASLPEILEALQGDFHLAPQQIDADIANIQQQIADLQNPDLYFQSDQTAHMVGTLQDQLAMLEQAKAQLASTAAAAAQMGQASSQAAVAVAQVGPASSQAAAGARQASAAASDLQARLTALSGQANATQSALRSMWIGAAGALGAEQALHGLQSQQIELGLLTQGWYMMGLTSEQVEFEKAAWLDKSSAKIQAQVQALTAVGSAASSAGSAVGSMQSDLQSSIASMVSGQVSGALTLDVAWPGKDSAGGDAINENAKRLAAIANEGLIGQDWLGQFAQEAPATYADLMLKIAEGMDAQGAARLLLGEFQAGMRPDLLNFDSIKQQVKDQLTSQQAIQQMTGDITSQLMAEMGVSAEQVQGAMGQLGLGGGALAGGATGEGMDLSAPGTQAAGSFSTAFIDGVNVAGLAVTLAGRINTDFLKEDAQSALKNSATAVGVFWGKMFTDEIANNTPAQLLSILTDQLLPLLQKAQAAQASQTGAF